MTRIEGCLSEYREWCAKLGIVSISDMNDIIRRGEVNRLINISEIWHEQKISEIAWQIKNDIKNKKLILISGPSSSGKTSFATRLSLHLKVLGISSCAISLDDYYYPRELIPLDENGKYDFETVEAINYPLFNKNVEDLIAGREAQLPIFDFKTSSPKPQGRTLRLAKDEVMIVEGIHALNDKLSSSIAEENKYKIYCTALTALCDDEGERIRSRTTRLIRRLIRDKAFRNSSADETLDLWPRVETGAEKYIYPFTDSADIIFNSSLLYEHSVYKIYLNELIFDMNKNSPYLEMMEELSALLSKFKLIDRDVVPRTSLVREFVGGSTIIEQ